MTKPATDKPMRPKANASPYSAAWAVLGVAGLGYLGIAFFAPQLLPDLSHGRQHAAETTVMKVSADVETLKASLSKIESDISIVKADVATQATQTEQLSSQVAALDDKVRVAQAQTPAVTTTASAAQPTGTDAAPVDDADGGPAPPKIINSPPRVGAPIETGSVDKKSANKPISFGPAVVKPAPHPYGIQIATDPSIDGLRITWGALSQIHPEQLSQLKARYADVGTAGNPNYGLIAGPVKSKAEARKLCKELLAQSISCKVSDYRGNVL
ncbi:SPOR domain-containing protein [Hyphomicrobium sp. B1]|uniref:SPOR domain-containing protein n=1 Tax=unclassified Hyphomicrobium TaxID=2619925 RepID=UPI0039C43EE7